MGSQKKTSETFLAGFGGAEAVQVTTLSGDPTVGSRLRGF